MKDDRSSFTAKWVAACRGLGALLPDDVRLADDPYGAEVAGAVTRGIVAAGRAFPAARPALLAAALPMLPHVLYMQVRTRLIDDALRAFIDAGGRQIVLLGAGFDARASRFEGLLAGGRVFEVDHPATQRDKRARLGEARAATYIAWDFERDAARDLPARLAAEGLDRARPSLTIWEGVTMYLTEPAIEATVAAVRAWSGPGSRLPFTYMDSDALGRPRGLRRVVARAVARAGEPFRWGWDPAALPAWLRAHGLSLLSDETTASAGRRLLPAVWAWAVSNGTHAHIAIAEPLPG